MYEGVLVTSIVQVLWQIHGLTSAHPPGIMGLVLFINWNSDKLEHYYALIQKYQAVSHLKGAHVILTCYYPTWIPYKIRMFCPPATLRTIRCRIPVGRHFSAVSPWEGFALKSECAFAPWIQPAFRPCMGDRGGADSDILMKPNSECSEKPVLPGFSEENQA